jgi:hypothetical protein
MESLRERFFAVADITTEIVDLGPPYDMKVEVRSMSGLERARTLQSWTGGGDKIDPEKLYPAIIIATVYDPETGERLFHPGDEDELNARSAVVLEQLATVALRLSGMAEGLTPGEASAETDSSDSSST